MFDVRPLLPSAQQLPHLRSKSPSRQAVLVETIHGRRLWSRTVAGRAIRRNFLGAAPSSQSTSATALAEAALELVLLDSDDRASLLRGLDDGLPVNRLDGVEADDAATDPFQRELFGRSHGLVSDGPGEEDRRVGYPRARDRLAELELDRPFVHRRLLLVAAAVIEGAVVVEHGVDAGLGLRKVAGQKTTMFGSARMMAMSSVACALTPSAP